MMTSSASKLLQKLAEDFHAWRLQDAPEYATTADVHAYNHQMETLSLAKFQQRKAKCEDFLGVLQTIPTESLSENDHINYELLRDHFQTYISAHRWRYHSVCNPVSFLEGIHINFESYLIEATPFKNDTDFNNYIKRLRCVPVQIDQQVALMREAISHHTTLHRASVEKVPKQLLEITQQDMTSHPFYQPCRKHIDVIEGTPSKEVICASVEDTIRNEVNPAFERLRRFLEDEYLPATRQHEGVWSLPDGREFYKACLNWHLSDDIGPDEVHQQGLIEVARLRSQMQEIMKTLGFQGNLAEFFTSLREDQSFYFGSKDDLLYGYRDIIEKRINPKLSQLFHKLPSIDCEVRPMPFDGPGGQYNPPAEDGSRPGVFQVNLTHPETIASFSMAALTLHEVSPGHHMQISQSILLDLPEFRKKIDYRNQYPAPLAFPMYTAYCEGWALYAEDLGMEMGVYSSPYELFGKLSEEMFRACRLVVDTGLHWLEWTGKAAADYMSSNCLVSENEVENEIRRYITWPGQACAYKIGQLKIKSLRNLAESELGAGFDVKGFHNVILNMSSVPLHVLEDCVGNWIKRQM